MRHASLFRLILPVCLAFIASPALAAALSPGTLIKASGPAVYYYSQNGKRLVFPTERTFKTWYADFSTVQTISDTELSAISLGGNVTYRPGVKLVKITTDPRVYAVAANGTLRHIASESVAAALYGSDWNTRVDDLPDAFFTNYKLGSPINNAADFNSAAITQTASSIDVDKAAAVTPPAATSTPPVTATTTEAVISLTVSKNPVHLGDVETLYVTASHPKGIRNIKIFFDSQLVTGCDYTTNCTGEYAMPVITNKNAYEAKTVVTSLNYQEFTKTLNVPLASSTAASPLTKIKVDRQSIRPGQMTGIVVESDVSISVRNITIYVDGNAHKSCEYQGGLCGWTETFNGAVGTVFTIHGIITDTVGRTYRTENKTITLAANDTPQIDFSSGYTPVSAGNSLMVTVTPSDENGILWSELQDGQHQALKHCEGAVPCTLTTGPWTQKGSVTLYGKAADFLGAIGEQSFTFQVQ